MTKQRGLVVNLDRCMGCFACEVACKQEHALAKGEKWIHVETLGPYEVGDELAMDFVPLATEDCDFCESRVAGGERPFCAQVCPTQALGLYGEEEILRLLHTSTRFQICRMAA